jgi:hypothetical protein
MLARHVDFSKSQKRAFDMNIFQETKHFMR